MILGLVARELGYFDEAIRRLRTAARLGKESGNSSCAAWASLAAFRLLAEREPKEVVSTIIQEARTLVTRLGDPHLAASLHESVARYEAQAGNLDEARRHLRVATELLTTFPNAWLKQLVAVNEFCVEFSDCNLHKAEERLRHASSLEGTTGCLAQTIATNLGHILIQVGKFEDAEKTLLGTATRNVGLIRQSSLDGLARLYLAANRLEECERTLDELSEVEKSAELVPSFLFRSSLLTRTRLLLHRAKWHEAIQTADTAIAASLAIPDHVVLGTAFFLRGLALSKINRPRDAAISIGRAVDAGAWSIRESQGMLLQACSVLAFDRDAELASQWFLRAKRVWREQGNLSAETEFQQYAAEVNAAAAEKRAPSTNGAVLGNTTGLVSSLADTFELSYNPRLLADGLKHVIEQLGCSPAVGILEQSSSASDGNHETVTLPVGQTRKLTLICQVPDDPLKAVLLGDVLRIGRAAIALERAREEERNRAALWPADPVEEQGDAIFLAEEMQTLLATVRRIAPTTVPVLITGETGTGKEVLARTIHACSARAKHIFLPFNCASTPKDMLDSQLFGHRRGAFTGAVEHFQGVVRTAAGGTLFLDEIGDAGLDVQPKLLRFLDAGEVHAIGDAQPSKVDVRVIVATNADLDRLVTEGRFRDDLFYRLSIVRLHIPPLRERRVEIPSLANHYLRKHAKEYSKGDLRLSEETMEYLVLYKWPGNVRQLASEMRRLAALAESDAVLMPEQLSPEIAASRRTIPPSERVLDATEVVVRLDQPLAAATQHLEQAMLQYALKKCDGRVEDTAAMLGISRKGLYLKRLRFGIDPPAEAPKALAG
jgi:DNA-binding NtrC family response regulator/tetratricopeptide (TPR) repeat protein